MFRYFILKYIDNNQLFYLFFLFMFNMFKCVYCNLNVLMNSFIFFIVYWFFYQGDLEVYKVYNILNEL